MTFRFETDEGELYDFKGVNHNLIIALYYYEPKRINTVMPSILNPDYNPNFHEYQYKQEEQETESDDDEVDFSRDNINLYKTNRLNYDQKGIEYKNRLIANQYKKNYDKQKLQNQILNQKIRQISYSSGTSTDESE